MRWLEKFTTQDLIIVAIIGALGMAIKPIITPIVHLVSGPLLIPGGSLAGGFYMLWLGVVIVLVPRRGSAFLIGLTQGITTLILGHFGNHGVLSILSYTLPGLTADLVALFFKEKHSLYAQVTICASANFVGTIIVASAIMRLPVLPLAVSLTTAIISGIAGGVISYNVIKRLIRYNFFATNVSKKQESCAQ
ncbi:MAG: ECF transporter S component [Candidatus Cloacimonadia bacterium]